jgi:hypothetical protein
MRLSRIERIKLESAAPVDAQQMASLEELAAQMMGGPLHKTQREYVFSDEKVSWLTGPIGTGKTAAVVARTTIPALCLPGSRWFIARAVKWTLEETTLPAFLKAWKKLGPGLIVDKQESPIIKYWLAPAVPGVKGRKPEPVEFIFHSLDDLEKLGGTEFTGATVDEANEITQQQASTLDGRLRHPLPGQARPEGPFYLNLLSNPVRRSHWLHKMFCGEEDCELVPWGKKYLTDKTENEAFLPPGYYEDRAKGMTPEMRLRFIDGQCGPDPAGEGVFSDEFSVDLHVRDLKFNPRLRKMIRGWDFGRRRPACVWAQLQPNGQLWRLAAMMGNNESLHRFAQRVLSRSAEQFPGIDQWTDFVDPHGAARRDVSEETSHSVLQKMGITPRFRDVAIATRLELMSKGLATIIEKKPRSQFDRTNCGLLIEGYGGGYCWPPASRLTGQLKDKPLADGWYEHSMDADGYIEVGLAMGSGLKHEDFKSNVRRVVNPYTGR